MLLAALCGAALAAEPAPPMVVAVVDDGVAVDLPALAGVRWAPGGRDVADRDDDPRPPLAQLVKLSHGTGLVALLWAEVRADEPVAVLPVKAVADQADHANVTSGYAGIAAAVDAGARVVLCAWGSERVTDEDRSVVAAAVARGVLIVASAGNANTDRPQYPAALPGVLAVAALDGSEKLGRSNFGVTIDLAAQGGAVPVPSAAGPDVSATLQATSRAAATVAGVAAGLWSRHPDWSADQVETHLRNTARPPSATLEAYATGVGAGEVDPEAARTTAWATPRAVWSGATARIPIVAGTPASVLVTPVGFVHQIVLRPTVERLPGRVAKSARLTLHAGRLPTDPVVWSGPLAELPETLTVPASRSLLRYEAAPGRQAPIVWLDYRAEPLYQDGRYCRGTVTVDAPRTLTDGSGDAPYAPRVDCKWLLQAPLGQVPRVRVRSIDTQPAVDILYLFDGDATIPAHAIAGLSGVSAPAEVLGWGPQVLMWFVGDEAVQGQGFEVDVDFVPAP